MATSKKSTRATGKKTAKKESAYHSVRSLRKAKEDWVSTVRDYNEKYFVKPFETGKDFVMSMKQDPSKTVGSLYEDGRGFIGNLRKDPQRVWENLMNDGKNLAQGTRKDFQKIVDNLVGGSRDVYSSVEKDTRRVVDDILDRGKKMTEWVPGRKRLEKEISRGLESIPNRLNLPSKKDMEKLSKTARTLNTRLNTLSKQYAA